MSLAIKEKTLRQIWNEEFATLLEFRNQINYQIALEIAEAANDYYNEGLTPEQAYEAF